MKQNPESQIAVPTQDRIQLSSVLEHAEWLRRLAQSLVHDGAEAEDVYQEAVLAARATSMPAGVPLRSWLAGITRNVAQARRRKLSRAKRREADVAKTRGHVPSALDDAALIERQRILLGGVEKLPEAQRRAIVGRFYDGTPPRTLAVEEGVPVRTIHSRIQRGLESLRRDLDGTYGDRATWAAWAVPMAGMKTEAKLGAVWAASFAAVGVALVGGLAWKGLGPAETTEPPSPDSLVVLVEPDQEDPVELGLDSRLSPVSQVPAEGGTSELRSEAAKTETKITILRDGQPVPGADVFLCSPDDLRRSPDPDSFFTETMWNFGQRLTADADGTVTTVLPPPFGVMATTELGLGVAGSEKGEQAMSVTLERAAQLAVNVRDPHGRALSAEEQDQLQVVAFHRVRGKKLTLPNGRKSDGIFDKEESLFVRDGMVIFQNPWAGMTVNSETIGTDAWNRVSIEAVAIDLPGAPEFYPESVSNERYRPLKKRGSRGERELRMPPIGSVRFEVVDRRGQADPVDGSLQFQFAESAQEGQYPRDYRAEVRGGIADVPRFVVGSRRFKYQLVLPDEGARIEGEGVGPGRKGQRSVVTIVREERSLVTARLLDGDGGPHAESEVLLKFYRRDGDRTWHQGSISGKADAHGAVRFEIPEEWEDIRCFSIGLSKVVRRKLQEAMHLWDTPEGATDGGIALGDLTLALQPRVPIEGVVLGDDGDPVAGVLVGARSPGVSSIAVLTDDDGAFRVEIVRSDDVHLDASIGDESLLKLEYQMASEDWGQPIKLVMGSGATFYTSLDTTFLGSGSEVLSVALHKEQGSPKNAYLKRADGGGYEGRTLRPGRYSLVVQLMGNVPIVTVPGIEIPPSGSVRDERVDAIRLEDHIRLLSVSWEGPGVVEHARPRIMVSSHAAQQGVGGKLTRWVHSAYAPDRYLVPKRIPASVQFSFEGGGVAYFQDAASLADDAHIAFPDPIVARVTLEGSPAEGFRYSLVGKAQTPVSGLVVNIDTTEIVDGQLTLNFPAEGRYRLRRTKVQRPRSVGDGVIAVAAAKSVPVDTWVQIREGDSVRLRLK